MPPPDWPDWVHVVWSTRGHWIPGDTRGFRDRAHRVHSTGDYQSPPPPEEHAGLRRHARALCPGEVVLPEALRPIIAEALARKFLVIDAFARIVAVSRTHVHSLIRAGPVDVRGIVGRAKQAASHAVRRELPGKIWGQRCHPERIRDERHYRAAVQYIARHVEEGAAIWIHPRVGRGEES